MKLFIAIPAYGGIDPHFVNSLLTLVTQRPRPCEMVVRLLIGDSLVARARNRLCAGFLKGDYTHLLFLDSDLIFSPEHVARLIGHAREGARIVGGLYPKKQKELAWVCNTLDQQLEPARANGLQRVKYAGTGCLLIARSVLDEMRRRLPEIEYDPDEGDATGVKWDFFATGVRTFPADQANAQASVLLRAPRRRYLSEDWMFCQRARDLGMNVWMDTQVVLKHVGECIYPLQDIESFAEVVAAD